MRKRTLITGLVVGGLLLGLAGTAAYARVIRIASIAQVRIFTEALSPTVIAVNTTAEQTFTVPGLNTSDVVYVNKPTVQAGLGICGARVTAANTLGICFSNNTGSTITPTAAETYSIGAIRS
jgi:hypothetical protein